MLSGLYYIAKGVRIVQNNIIYYAMEYREVSLTIAQDIYKYGG